MNENEIQETEKKPKEYTAFGITGGIGVMITVFFVMLITKYAYTLTLHLPDFIKRVKNIFGG